VVLLVAVPAAVAAVDKFVVADMFAAAADGVPVDPIVVAPRLEFKGVRYENPR